MWIGDQSGKFSREREKRPPACLPGVRATGELALAAARLTGAARYPPGKN